MTQPSMREGELLAGRYRMGSLLGEGGYGRVYRATQMPLGREVAIKVVNAGDKELIARFAREAEIAQRLEHPNTVRVLDYGTTPEGLPFLALELLRGKSVHELLCEKGMLDLETSLAITSQVLKSLAEAHAKGIVHRDIKPENIFVSSHPGEPVFVKVLDFGIAKEIKNAAPLTVHGEAVGTPSYMSPEQVMGLPLDGRTDIYAVGLLLAEMVTGTTVFDVGGPRTIMRAQLQNEPVALTRAVTESVVGVVVERAVRKRAAERYQTVLEMLAAVEALAAHVKAEGEGGPRFSSSPTRSPMGPTSVPLPLMPGPSSMHGVPMPGPSSMHGVPMPGPSSMHGAPMSGSAMSAPTIQSAHVPQPAPSSPASGQARISAPTMVSGGGSAVDETRPLSAEQLKNVYAMPFVPRASDSGAGAPRASAASATSPRQLPLLLILGVAVAMVIGLSVIVILLATRDGREDRPRRTEKREVERESPETESESAPEPEERSSRPKGKSRGPTPRGASPTVVTSVPEMRAILGRARYAITPEPTPADAEDFVTLQLIDSRCTGVVVKATVVDRDARIRARDTFLQTPNTEALVEDTVLVMVAMHGLSGRIEFDAECTAAVAKLLKK